MEEEDYEIIRALPQTLLQLAGNLHRAQFDKKTREIVQEDCGNLVRAFTLLGSGLLSADAPSSGPQVSKVLCELSLSDAARNVFPWSQLSSEHLFACSIHLARIALGESTVIRVPDLAYSEATTVVLEQVESLESSSDDGLSQLIYLSRFLRHLPNSSSLASRLQNALNRGHVSSNSRNETEAQDIVGNAWNHGSALFNLTRKRLFIVVESGLDAQSISSNCVIGVASDLAALYATSAPVRTVTIALILCRSIHPAHRSAGVHVVRSLALSGLERHFDACIEAIREAVVLPFGSILVQSVSCLVLLFSTSRPGSYSLASPDPRRIAATQVIFDALVRCVDDGGPAAAASCYVLPDVVELTGTTLFMNMSTFVRLFSTLFVSLANQSIPSDYLTYADEICLEKRSERYNPNLFDSLCDAFENTANLAWPRLQAHRKTVIQVCLSAMLEASERTRSQVHAASMRIVTSLLYFDSSDGTELVLKAILERIRQCPSLKNAAKLLTETLEYGHATSNMDKASGQFHKTKFGRIALQYSKGRAKVTQ